MASLGIPEIDLRPWLFHHSIPNNEEIEKSKALSLLRSACFEWGFFYLNVAPLDQSPVFNNLHRAMNNLFIQVSNENVLDQCRRSETNAFGYFDVEFTKNKQDWKRGFDCGFHEVNEVEGVNRWPDEYVEPKLVGFKSNLQNYMQEMAEIAEKLLGLILESLSDVIDPQEAKKLLKLGSGDHRSFLRMNYYPACPENAREAQFGIRHHTDAGLLTLLWQDEQLSSLQVYLGDESSGDIHIEEDSSQWINIPPVPGTLVVNFGDMLKVLTNGHCKAALHRVLVNGESDRFSVPFFYNPSYDTSCAPLVHSEKHQFKAINWGDFRRKRFEGDYADVGKEIQIVDFTPEESS